MSCIQHFVKIKPLIRETKVSYLGLWKTEIWFPQSVDKAARVQKRAALSGQAYVDRHPALNMLA